MPARLFLVVALILLSGCRAERPNIVLITFDTTRADHVGYAAGRSGLTPNIDRLAANGVWFSNAIAAQPITGPAHASILTGLYPFHHGVRNNGTYVLDPSHTTLASILQGQGYVTHAVVASFVLDHQFGFNQGFDSYDDDFSGGPLTNSVFKEIRANQVSDKAIRWLDVPRPAGKPFFLWLHYYDPHAPYVPPDDIAAKFPGDPYSGEINFTDREMGRVLEHIHDLGLDENTIIVLTADHGESLGEHGESGHGIFVYDSTTHVPLLISGKSVAKGRRVDSVVRSVDIAPTILDLAGVEPPPALDGVSMTSLWRDRGEARRAAYSESLVPRLNFGWSELRSVRTADARVVEAPRREVYDVVRDPKEVKNLFVDPSGQPPDARRLFAILQKIRHDDPFEHGRQGEQKIDAETRQRLAALGYITGGGASHRSNLDPKDHIAEWEKFQFTQALMQDRQFADAVKGFRELLSSDPDDPVIKTALAAALDQNHESDAALNLYKRVIELDPDQESAYLGSSRILRAQGRFAEAEELSRAATRLHPESADGYVELGDIYLDQSRFAESESMFRKAMAIDPRAALAISGLGNCLNRSGRTDEALGVLQSGHSKLPGSAAITYNLAVVTERRGDLATARKLLRETVRLDPTHSLAWNNLGSLLDRAGDRNQAIACITEAHRLDPANFEAAYNLGALLQLAGRPAEALPLLEQAMKQRPDFIAAGAQRAAALMSLGRIDDAISAWHALTEKAPAAWLQIARLELLKGNERRARSALENGEAKGGRRFNETARKDPALARILPPL